MKKAIGNRSTAMVDATETEATEPEAVTIYATEPTETAGDPLAKYRDMTYLEFDEPRPICQRHELATA